MPLPLSVPESLFGDLEEQPFITAIVPARDQIRGVAREVVAMADYFHARHYPFEILVVDGGSQDGTGVLVDELARRAKREIGTIRFVPNGSGRQGIGGPGSGVAAGFKAARGKYVLVAHPEEFEDCAYTPEVIAEIEPLISALDQGFHAALNRQHALFTGGLVETIAPRVRVQGPAYLVEILQLARRIGFRVKKLAAPRSAQGTFRRLAAALQTSINEVRGAYRLDELRPPAESRYSARLAVVR